MARKSRKPENLRRGAAARPAKPSKKPARIWRCAIYCRLSVEDNGRQEGASIAAQEAIVRTALSKMDDVKVVGVYRDNGYSGTSFDSRPAFNDVLRAVHDDEVDCVAVKDLSRFGRNHIESGYYIERIFPLLGVRFIAVNDGLDTELESPAKTMALPLKNLVNEAYARDVSRKVLAARAARIKEGRAAVFSAPYGYVVDPDNNTRLVLDPQAAPVVRRIFDMALAGVLPAAIAATLNEDGVPTPFVARGLRVSNGEDLWGRETVCKILRNEAHTGRLVQNKTFNLKFPVKRMGVRDSSEHLVTEGAHDAIVTQGEFDAVAASMDERARQVRDSLERNAARRALMPDAFAGVGLYCAHCGRRMAYVREFRGDSTVGALYTCHKRPKKAKCPDPIKVDESLLKIVVGDEIRRQVALHATFDEMEAEIFMAARIGDRLAKAQDEAERAELDVEHAAAMRRSIYAEFADGCIDEDEWAAARDSVKAVADAAGSRLASRRALVEELSRITQPDMRAAMALERIGTMTCVDREVVDAFVRRVDVFGPTDIRITFKFEDYIDRVRKLRGMM